MNRIWIYIVIGIPLIGFLILYGYFCVFRENEFMEPATFEFFIAKTFFKEDNYSPFKPAEIGLKKPTKWHLQKDQFEAFDSVEIAFENLSAESYYYPSWGAPLTRIREDLIIFKNGLADTVAFGGHGCATGVYMAKCKDEEVMVIKHLNPLIFNPYSGYYLDLESDTFPEIFKELYGDSVWIRYSQPTYSLPWKKYPSQLIQSNYLSINTNKLMERWNMNEFINIDRKNYNIEEIYLGIDSSIYLE